MHTIARHNFYHENIRGKHIVVLKNTLAALSVAGF